MFPSPRTADPSLMTATMFRFTVVAHLAPVRGEEAETAATPSVDERQVVPVLTDLGSDLDLAAEFRCRAIASNRHFPYVVSGCLPP
jgi:hypothetical protein